MNKGCLTRVVLLPLAVIILAAGAAVGIVKMKPTSKREAPARVVPAADIIVAQAETVNAQLTANGTVRPAKRVVLSPEVTGKVTYVSDALVVGGRVKKGQTLMRIDSSDYAIALEVEKLKVAQAEIELTLEKGRGDVAKREFDLLGNKKNGNTDLVLRVPQRQNAEARVKSALQAQKRAELNLARTALRAPFNALVVSENAERGAVMGQGSQVATLIGTDSFWVEASIPVAKLPLLNIPTQPGQPGSKVKVVQELGGSTVVREGTVLRLAGSLDTETRTATVIIEVQNPLEASSAIPLFPDAFVTVRLEGEQAKDVIAVPDSAIEDSRYAYILDKDNKLERRDVDVGWRGENKLFIRSGLEDGDRVIVSPLGSPVEGMELRLRRDLTSQFRGEAVGSEGEEG